jgi:riboflavin synthase
MFTGIVEEIGLVSRVERDLLKIQASLVLEGTQLGDSIAVNGVCLTVIARDGGSFSVEVMPETLRRTNLGMLRSGERVNLERALTPTSRLGGHFVQGHIDGTGRIVSAKPEDRAILVRFVAPPELMRYIVPKGFIAVDGASLTVADVDSGSFTVSLVSFTQRHITLGDKKPGSIVNLETDILGKYVERLLRPEGSKVSLDFLAEHGFMGTTSR